MNNIRNFIFIIFALISSSCVNMLHDLRMEADKSLLLFLMPKGDPPYEEPQRYLYATNSGVGGDPISMYLINKLNGVLEMLDPPTATAGHQPHVIDVHPSGLFAFSANVNSVGVSCFSINPINGLLNSLPSAPSFGNSTSVAVHPPGQYLYATNWGLSSIVMFVINESNATLSALTPSSLTIGHSPYKICIHPSGRCSYTVSRVSNTIVMHGIDVLTGQLANISPSMIMANADALGLTIYPSNWLYFNV